MSDNVNHPAHYGGADNPYEVIKVIDAWKLGFALGNTVKYVARAAHKGSELEDLKKARWYLNHRIVELENQVAAAVQDSVREHLGPGAKLTGGGYMCPFCKSSVFKSRANPEEVFCVCGATAKWPVREKAIEQKLVELTGTRSAEEAFENLRIAWDFCMKHEERNPTHLLLINAEIRGIACGKKDGEVSSVTTSVNEVTCKACRVAFMRVSK